MPAIRTECSSIIKRSRHETTHGDFSLFGRAKYAAEAVLSIDVGPARGSAVVWRKDPAEPEGGRVCDGDRARCCGVSVV
jgi:hypothetical protein